MTTPDSSVRLVVSGIPLLTPQVGVGAYTLRLIAGLSRHSEAVPFRVILPEAARSAIPDLPEEFCVFLGEPAFHRARLVSLQVLAEQTVREAERRFPHAIFHSPGPLWSFHKPPNYTVVTLHDCIYRVFPLYLGRFFLRKWLAFASERFARKCSLVLTDSDFSAHDLRRLANVPEQMIRVLYPWVSPPYLLGSRAADEAARIRAAYALPESFWLYVGGFDYRKNVERLIAAYALAVRQRPCPPLVLAGRIPDRTKPPYSDVRGAIRAAGLKAGVVLTPGMIPEEDLPGLYAAATLFVYPSLYEGFGLPPAEAMAAGTPVLVADASSLREVVRLPECRFDPQSVERIAEKLLAATENPRQFTCAFPPEFTEGHAIAQYLRLLFPTDAEAPA